MKNSPRLILIVWLFCIISFCGVAQLPVISFKIAPQTTGQCYDVVYKSSIALTNAKVSDAQVTIVAPTGTSKQITNLLGTNGIAFSTTSTGGNFENQPYPNISNLEYIIFGLNAFNTTVAVAPAEAKLFSFCLNGSAPAVPLRLINGVSPVSVNLAQYKGAFDPAPANLDPYNSMSIFQSGLITDNYHGDNYGQTIVLANENIEKAKIGLYPNPAETFCKIEITTLSLSNFSYSLYNSEGKNILQKTFSEKSNQFNEIIELKNLPSGTYFIHLQIDNQKIVKKIIKL